MVKNRSIAMCIVLTIVTCGIYGLYWIACLNDDMNTLAGVEEGTSGVMVVVLSIVTCCIYLLYWAYKQGEKIDKVNGESSNASIIYLVVTFFCPIVAYGLMQNAINKAVEK